MKILTFYQEFEEGAKTMADEKTAGEKLEVLIKEKMKAKPELDYGAAFAEVQIENPELTETYIQELP
jgi:hypothetical protein